MSYYRRKTDRSTDRKAFQKTVDRTHYKNVISMPKRGGTRL